MTIDWGAFVSVFVASLVSAVLFVTLFAIALRLGDGTARWRRIVAVVLFVLCGLVVVFGLSLIIPWNHVFG